MKIAPWTVVTWNACWISKERILRDEMGRRKGQVEWRNERILCKIGKSLNENASSKTLHPSLFRNKKKITSALSSVASSSHFHRIDSQLFHKTELCVCEWLIKVSESLSKASLRLRGWEQAMQWAFDGFLTTLLLLPIMMTMPFYIQLLSCSYVEISGRLISIVWSWIDVRVSMSGVKKFNFFHAAVNKISCSHFGIYRLSHKLEPFTSRQ